MKPRPDSLVIGTFGTSTETAAGFLRRWIPAKWKPRTLQYGIGGDMKLEGRWRVYRVEHIPPEIFNYEYDPADRAYQRRIDRLYKALRDDLFRWLYALEDSGKIGSQGGGGQFGKGVATFDRSYIQGCHEGLYTATLIQDVSDKATLILHLVETPGSLTPGGPVRRKRAKRKPR